MAEVIGEGTFDVGDFEKELDAARQGTRQIGKERSGDVEIRFVTAKLLD